MNDKSPFTEEELYAVVSFLAVRATSGDAQVHFDNVRGLEADRIRVHVGNVQIKIPDVGMARTPRSRVDLLTEMAEKLLPFAARRLHALAEARGHLLMSPGVETISPAAP